MESVKFKVGTSEEFKALTYKDPLTIYWLLDTQQIFKGSLLMGTGLINELGQTEEIELYGGSASNEEVR